jgi:hypothetical protein
MFVSDQVSYPALIGTSAALSTLTTAYTDNTCKMSIRYMPNVNLTGSYVPGAGSTNSVISMLIETSEDGTNWSPRPVVNPTSTAVLDYTKSVPITIPGDSVSSASTAVPIAYQDTIVAKFIRVSIKETVGGGGAAGTVWLQGTAASN